MRPDSKPASASTGRDTASECRRAHAFIGRFFEGKPVEPRRVEDWREWATSRITLAGWDSERVAAHLTEAWSTRPQQRA